MPTQPFSETVTGSSNLTSSYRPGTLFYISLFLHFYTLPRSPRNPRSPPPPCPTTSQHCDRLAHCRHCDCHCRLLHNDHPRRSRRQPLRRYRSQRCTRISTPFSTPPPNPQMRKHNSPIAFYPHARPTAAAPRRAGDKTSRLCFLFLRLLESSAEASRLPVRSYFRFPPARRRLTSQLTARQRLHQVAPSANLTPPLGVSPVSSAPTLCPCSPPTPAPSHVPRAGASAA
jgi:hypothetical protein